MDTRSILITGGTSGLGKELASIFLKNGFSVVVTGRQDPGISGQDNRFRFVRVDFGDLKESAALFRDLCSSFKFDIVVNNAGILSPPGLTITGNGIEYTMQVNFLSHLLLNEIIIRNRDPELPLRICTITSPVYRMVDPSGIRMKEPGSYSPARAYSESKFLIAVMPRLLASKFPGHNLKCISFNPGIFASGIYRMQGGIFRTLYRIAAPFMRSPEVIAGSIFNLLSGSELRTGVIYDRRYRIMDLPEFPAEEEERLAGESYLMTEPFMV